MRAIKRTAVVAVSLLIFFGVIIFILENQQATSLTFLGWNTPQLPAALFFVGALLLGLAIGPLIGFLAYWRKTAGLKRRMHLN
ncbi:lipopolysaccharide assembly protein LapA domain-containing protein [Pseudomonas lundensis]|uniref:lipopolysaccharide assembly protein LapA domain-containing protein n=1 Tax=Pseudomonas lundensis TaxID=86185 RepID=UPI000641D847|nr:lipopolysaccharide assembly protein LapA domain-containing protein [Pseudomonas lundensis]